MANPGLPNPIPQYYNEAQLANYAFKEYRERGADPADILNQPPNAYRNVLLPANPLVSPRVKFNIAANRDMDYAPPIRDPSLRHGTQQDRDNDPVFERAQGRYRNFTTYFTRHPVCNVFFRVIDFRLWLERLALGLS